MIAAPDCCQYCSGHCLCISRTANKAIITEVVEKDEIVTYNARLSWSYRLSVLAHLYSLPLFYNSQSPCDPSYWMR